MTCCRGSLWAHCRTDALEPLFSGTDPGKTAAILGMTQVQVSRREKKLLTQLRQELLS
ncbi:MAG: hypothetical protein ACLR5S_04910 [Ruminococcus sp.]